MVVLLALTAERVPGAIDARRRRFPARGCHAWDTRMGRRRCGCCGPNAHGCDINDAVVVAWGEGDLLHCCLRLAHGLDVPPDGGSAGRRRRQPHHPLMIQGGRCEKH